MSYANAIPVQYAPSNMADYLERERIVRDTPARVKPDGKVYRIVRGVEFTEAEFLDANPPVKLIIGPYKGENIGSARL